MKKWIAWTTALIMSALMCGSALAGQMPIAWNVDGAVLNISGFASVPSHLSQYLTRSQAEQITVISIGEGVTGIEDYAFDGFPNVEYLEIPASVVAIGGHIMADEGGTYWIQGDEETAKALLAEHNSETTFLMDGETAVPKDTPVPRQTPAAPSMTIDPAEPQAAPETMAKFHAVLAYLCGQNLDVQFVRTDLHGANLDAPSYRFDVTDQNDRYVLTLGADSDGIMNQIMVTTETLDPGPAWETICRGMAALDVLELPEAIRGEMETVSLRNGGRAVYVKGGGWTLNVGGVMDVRSGWNLTR